MDILGKLSVILATTLSATNSSEFEVFVEQCTDTPCQSVEARIAQREVLMPFAIALAAWLVASVPAVVFKGSSRVLGIRCCLWALVRLWIGLLLALYLLSSRYKAQAYVFALHYTVNLLGSWRLPRKALAYPNLQRFISLIGASAVSTFAWQAQVPVGLAAWYGQANCGWAVHLTACLNVDAMAWVFRLLEPFVC